MRNVSRGKDGPQLPHGLQSFALASCIWAVYRTRAKRTRPLRSKSAGRVFHGQRRSIACSSWAWQNLVKATGEASLATLSCHGHQHRYGYGHAHSIAVMCDSRTALACQLRGRSASRKGCRATKDHLHVKCAFLPATSFQSLDDGR